MILLFITVPHTHTHIYMYYGRKQDEKKSVRTATRSISTRAGHTARR